MRPVRKKKKALTTELIRYACPSSSRSYLLRDRKEKHSIVTVSTALESRNWI
jgi:hypothetical protein